MIKKVVQGILLLFLIAAAGHAQEKCPFPPSTAKPFIAGHPDRDSLSVEDILGASKLSTKISGLEIISFHIGTGNGCVGGSGLYTELRCNSNELTSEAARLLKCSQGQTFYFDHVHASNQAGEMYCLKPTSIFVKKPIEVRPSRLQRKYQAGYDPPGARTEIWLY
jgi:hypothetical protein